MTLHVFYPLTNRELKFTDLSQREINRLITHASNCRERDGEFDIKITVTEK